MSSSTFTESFFAEFQKWASANPSTRVPIGELAQLAQVEQMRRIADELVEINEKLESIETLTQKVDSMADAIADAGINLHT